MLAPESGLTQLASALPLLGDVLRRPHRQRQDRPGAVLVGLRDERAGVGDEHVPASCAWQFLFSTDVDGSLPMRVTPTSWMMRPPGLDAVALLRGRHRRHRRAAHLGDDRAEGLLHVLDLLVLVVAPLEVEAQHRDAPLVDHGRIDLAVAVRVGDHLAAAGEVDRGAVEPAVVVLQLLAVAAERHRMAGRIVGRVKCGCRRRSRRSACGGRRSARCDSRAGNPASCCPATTACRGASRRCRPRCAGCRPSAPG